VFVICIRLLLVIVCECDVKLFSYFTDETFFLIICYLVNKGIFSK